VMSWEVSLPSAKRASRRNSPRRCSTRNIPKGDRCGCEARQLPYHSASPPRGHQGTVLASDINPK
jgi:hypothetical protein